MPGLHGNPVKANKTPLPWLPLVANIALAYTTVTRLLVCPFSYVYMFSFAIFSSYCTLLLCCYVTILSLRDDPSCVRTVLGLAAVMLTIGRGRDR